MNKEKEQYKRVMYLADIAKMHLSSGQQVSLSELIYLGDSLTNKRQSGITTLLSFMVLDQALYNSNNTILIVSNSLQMAKYNLQLILELLEKIKNNGFSIEYKFEKGKRIIRFPNGSRVILGNNYIESNVYDVMFVDNATFLHQKVLLSILQSFNSGKKKLYMASNIDSVNEQTG